MFPRLIRTAAVAACLTLAGVATAQDRATVVAVNYPLQSFASHLLGPEAEVVYPVPDGVDPSFWRPAIADISLVQSADLILLSGAGFAGWVERVTLPRARVADTSRAYQDRFITTQTITHSHGAGGAHSHEGLASYTWLDPSLAIAQAEAVAAAITARDLAPAEDVAARLDTLRADLQALDAEARAALTAAQGVPLIATHPRYQYLARAYGLQIGALEWDAGAMPTGAELDALWKLAGETGAKVLLWEAEPPAEAIEAVTALGLHSVTFPPLAVPPGEAGFAGSFRQSVAALAAAVEKATAD